MSSPLNSHYSQKDLTQHDTFDTSIYLQPKPSLPFKKRRIPGKLTSKQLSSKSQIQIIDELITLKQFQTTSNKELFKQFEGIAKSLLEKNDGLMEENGKLRRENKKLKSQVKELEYQIKLFQNNTHLQPSTFSIMNYFNSISLIPIVSPIDGTPYQLLEKNLCACKYDNNSNIRAFYLSMLQHAQTRKLLHELICHYENDDSWKLVPLLSTNESWVQLSINFFKVLDSSEFEEIEEIYSFINESELYDLIFVSALRSRVEFLCEGYDSEIETMTLYTGLCNIFGNEKINFNRKQHIKYDTYNFELEDIGFTIYFIEDINQYSVSFYQPERLFSSVESYDAVSGEEEQYGEGIEMEEGEIKGEEEEEEYGCEYSRGFERENYDSSQSVVLLDYNDD